MKHYKNLELKPDCSMEDIKANYKKLAKLYHPDKPIGNHDKFVLIKESFDYLIKNHRTIKGGTYFLLGNMYLQDNGNVYISFSCNNLFAIKDVSTPYGGTFFIEKNTDSDNFAIMIERSILVESKYYVKLQIYPIVNYPHNSWVETIRLPDRRTPYEIIKQFLNL